MFRNFSIRCAVVSSCWGLSGTLLGPRCGYARGIPWESNFPRKVHTLQKRYNTCDNTLWAILGALTNRHSIGMECGCDASNWSFVSSLLDICVVCADNIIAYPPGDTGYHLQLISFPASKFGRYRETCSPHSPLESCSKRGRLLCSAKQ